MHQQAVNALKVLIVESKHKKCYVEALNYAKRIVELDPLEEEAHEQIMILLAQLGCVAEALHHYQHYVRFLKREVAAEPEPQLTALYQNIRSGIAIIQEAEPKPPLIHANGRGATTRQLPKPLTPLLGRAETLQQLQRYLTDPTIRLVTLTGMGGIGKTHLALTVAEQIALHFDDIILLPLHELRQATAQPADNKQESQLDERRQAGQVIQELALTTAAALQLPLSMNDSLIHQLGAYIQQQLVLLIFDGFEHWAAGAHFLVDLLQEAPRLKVFVTSRESLQLPGESILHLEGLALPQAEEEFLRVPQQETASITVLTTVQEYTAIEKEAPSLQLFLHCLQRQSPQQLLYRESLQTIRQICRLVEGNPLAIELAAGLSFHYSWGEIVERLQQGLEILGTAQRGRAQRQRTMQTVLTDSWQLLSVQEQMTLSGLSHLNGSFGRDEAITATDCAPERLMALVNKSWVRSKGAGRYELPHLIRLFIRSQPPSDQPSAAQ